MDNTTLQFAVTTTLALVLGRVSYYFLCQHKQKADSLSPLRVCACRFRPGEEIKSSLIKFAKENDLKAGFILSAVGSVTGAKIRLAKATSKNPNEIRMLKGKHEIVSLIGTISGDGGCHLHTSLGDAQGNVVGGHLMGEMPVFTTCEVVIGECEDLKWVREFDNCTGFDELEVRRR
mmetsp:Transcript_1241/g.1585  ORF Transcript_1241/g.1585 Transcript_1241/m.1585 type:complete len:176 (+) Transcript_1241:25-552(+)